MGNKIAIFLALILGAMAIVLVRNHLDTSKKNFIGTPIQIVVALKDIEAGEKIDSNKHFGRRTVPEKFIRGSNAYLEWDKRSKLLGGEMRYSVPRGSFLHMRLIERDEIEKANTIVVREGLRAYSMSTGAAVAGMLQIGDHIDLMGSFRILGEEVGVRGVRTEKTRTMFLMQDIEIKALDSQTRGAVQSYNTLTFELSPVECLVLEYAQSTGKITIVKRSSNERLLKEDENRMEVTRETLEDYIKSAIVERVRRNNTAQGE